MARLTAKTVETWKATDKRQEIPDAQCVGLYFIVQPTGRKSWTVRYRTGTKHRRMNLGKFPAVSLKDARDRANEILAGAMEGEDPAADRERKKSIQPDRDKVSVLFDQYSKRHLSELRSGPTVVREMNRHVIALWGERDIHEITKRDVIDLLDGFADSGRVVSANRVRAYVNKFLNWCVERDILAASPSLGVKPVAREKSRDRVLSDDEIRWFWQACTELGFPWGPLGKVLLLTGQRLGEVVGMSDREIQGDIWHLPSDRVKNGRAHTVPLSEAVCRVLSGIERIKSDTGLIFTTTGTTPLSGNHKGRNAIADRMAEIAGHEIEHWTFHDLRRTAATGMARLGIPVRVTEAVLNHVSGTGGGIVAVYQRHDYADEKRNALEAWARLVYDLVNGKADNVLRIRGAH